MAEVIPIVVVSVELMDAEHIFQVIQHQIEIAPVIDPFRAPRGISYTQISISGSEEAKRTDFYCAWALLFRAIQVGIESELLPDIHRGTEPEPDAV